MAKYNKSLEPNPEEQAKRTERCERLRIYYQSIPKRLLKSETLEAREVDIKLNERKERRKSIDISKKSKI